MVRDRLSGIHLIKIYCLVKTYAVSYYKMQIKTKKRYSSMIESENNAERKINRVISAAILKNANLGHFPKVFYCKLLPPVKCPNDFKFAKTF